VLRDTVSETGELCLIPASCFVGLLFLDGMLILPFASNLVGSLEVTGRGRRVQLPCQKAVAPTRFDASRRANTWTPTTSSLFPSLPDIFFSFLYCTREVQNHACISCRIHLYAHIHRKFFTVYIYIDTGQ
jgi:hypothetical protein